MKKKIISLALVIGLLAIAIAGGTLAYFTDTDEADNVMTIGNLKIQQIEYERKENADGKKTEELQLFTQNQKVFPAVYHEEGKDDGITDPQSTALTVNNCTISSPNIPNYVDKIVTVGNLGNSDAYVRTIIAVPATEEGAEWIHWDYVTDTDTTNNNGWYVGKTLTDGAAPTDTAKRYTVDSVVIDSVTYDLTVFTNVNPLEPFQETGPMMVGFYLDNDLDVDENGYYMTLNGEKKYIGRVGQGTTSNELNAHMIKVATQAVQTEGFTDAYAAFKASFGDITAGNHPWTN